MRRFSARSALLAAALAILAVPSKADDYLGPYGAAAFAVAGSTLNVVSIESRNANLYGIAVKGRHNILRSSQTSQGVAGLAATMVGARNEARVASNAKAGLVAVDQTSSGSLSGIRPTEGLQQMMVNGDYVTVYRSGGFGLIQISSDAPSMGHLGRGH